MSDQPMTDRDHLLALVRSIPAISRPGSASQFLGASCSLMARYDAARAYLAATTPSPIQATDDELIERGLRMIRTYDAVRDLRDALNATMARLTGYDWNADPNSLTTQQGDALAAADRVFADLDAAISVTDRCLEGPSDGR